MPCITPIEIKVYNEDRTKVLGYRKVPCGKCPACLRRRRSGWSFRIYQEYMSSVCAWFITLTYDNAHLPVDGVNKRDIQLFLKRFRKKRKCRFFIVTEYGDTFGRPHAHGILFFSEMVDLPDVVREVSDAWQNGNIQVGNVTLASINYCSKYSLKPRYDDTGIYPNKTFSLMSRKPGIGASWLTEDVKRIKSDSMDDTVFLDGFIYNMPRYYKDRIFNKIEKLVLNSRKQKEYGNKEKCPEPVRDQQWMWQYEQRCRKAGKR